MSLFVETKGRVGRFTVVKAEDFKDPITKRNVRRPGFYLTTVWSGASPGFLSTKHLSDSQKQAARAIWGDDWQKPLDNEVTVIGKSNGLVRVEETKEAMEAFDLSQHPKDLQATGARGLDRKKAGGGMPHISVTLAPFVEKAPSPSGEPIKGK